jgi:hypothetical protein
MSEMPIRSSTGFTRRPFLLAAASSAAVLGPSAEAASASITRDPAAVTVGLFVDLPSIAVPDGVTLVQTTGHSTVGLGAARYVATTQETTAPHRARTANGRWFELAEPLVFVEMFGARGNDSSWDDHPGIQAAIDYNEDVLGGVVWCSPGRTYFLGATVVIDPTRTSIEGGSASWDFRLKRFERGENACVLVRDPPLPRGAQYGQDSHYCRGLKVKGPRANPTVADGFYFDTTVAVFSSRWTFYNVEAIECLGRGLVLGNRAYLSKVYASSFIGFTAGVEFLGGVDAGENISFFGGNLGSSGGAGLKNNGAEFYLFGVSIDFPKAFIHQAAGTTHCFGCHFETGSRAGFAGRPFDIAGELMIEGGQIMGGAPLDGSPIDFDYFFYARDHRSRIILSNVWGYNWQGSEHVICGGPGRFVIERLLGGTNWNIPGVVKRDSMHSLTGDAGLFEQPSTALDVWVTAANATQRINRSHLLWSDRSERLGELSVERSVAQARTGAGSLAITKTGVGMGTDAECHVLIPFPSGGGRIRACEFWLLSAPHAPSATTAVLFTQLSWASLIGRDSDGVPQLGQTEYNGEAKLVVDLAHATSSWSRLSYGDPVYADPSDALVGYAPAWATHLRLSISLVSLPAITVFMDDLYAFAI